MGDYILEMKNITKEFPGVKALDQVNLQVERGEIHALVGENGAGKSTLMNVLSGIYPHGSYTGDIVYNGRVCQFHTLHDSEEQGIVIIHQELALIPELSIGENMFLGNERKGKLGIDWGRTFHEAGEHMQQVGLKEEPTTLIKDIGTGKQQLVEIAKALSKNVKLLILPRRESENLRVPVHVDERLPVADLSGEDYAVFQLRVFSVKFFGNVRIFLCASCKFQRPVRNLSSYLCESLKQNLRSFLACA